MKRAAWVGVVAVWLVSTACAGMSRQVTASVDDYETYRQFRMAPTFPEKLVAGWRYLQNNPRGHWREQVGGWFERADTAYYEQAQRNLMQLKVYLSLLPNGPNSALARQRVKQLEEERERQRERDRELDTEVVIMEIALQQAADQRAELLGAFLGFTKHLLNIESWGQPTWELDAPFLVDWRIREPRARCRRGRCIKTLNLPYAVPDALELAPRQAVFDVVLELRQGNVARAVLTGPELFTRVGEAAQVRAIVPDDVMGRAMAISEAMNLLEPLLDHRFPPDRCAREAVSPVVVRRECDGMRIVITAAAAPEEDRIVIEPAPAARAVP
jgi:hypothetical protein